jgi:hypothetical protein
VCSQLVVASYEGDMGAVKALLSHEGVDKQAKLKPPGAAWIDVRRQRVS